MGIICPNFERMEFESGLKCFTTIVEAGSLTAASRLLGVPRATVSRHLALLEAHYGVSLLKRTTRCQTLTEAGCLVYERGKLLLLEYDGLAASVRNLGGVNGRLSGKLRISAPPGSADTLRSVLNKTRALHPHLKLEIFTSSEFVDLVAEGFDIVFRAGAQADSLLKSRILFRDRVRVFGAPDYLETRGWPQRPEDLSKHECILGADAGRHPQNSWPCLVKGSVSVSGMLQSNNMQLRAQMAIDGHGLALLPKSFVHHAIEEGLLVPVLEEQVGLELQFRALYLDQKPVDVRIQAFLDLAIVEIQRQLNDPKYFAKIGRAALE